MRADRSRHSAVVSGAASGMGRAVAERFIGEGYKVIAVDPDAVALERIAATHHPASFRPALADVTDRSAIARALGDLSGLGIVVNAAGIYPPTTLDDYDPATYRRIFDVNVLGTLNVIAETAPCLRAIGGGAIVNFASIDAFAVSRGQLLYSASKAALVPPTRALAIELAAGGSRVNSGAPGWVDTPGTRAGGRMEEAVSTIPFGRAAQPEEIADWVWKLSQGSYLTGETIVIGGGLIVR